VLSEEELQLKARLDRVLGQVNAAPPPVAAVLRKGRIKRTGYHVAVSAAVIAVGLAGFAAVTQLGHMRQHEAPSTKPVRHHHASAHWPKERIVNLGPVAKNGVFAEGIVTGNLDPGTWKIWLDTRHNQIRERASSYGVYRVGKLKESVNPGSIGTFYPFSQVDWAGFYGVVSGNVTKVAVRLNDHQTVNLHPVAAAGRRWVGIITPIGVEPTAFTAYSGNTELGRALNFFSGTVTWLRPGQNGPATQTVRIGGGRLPNGTGHNSRVNLMVRAGPWGYCLPLPLAAFPGACMSPDTARSSGVKAIVQISPVTRVLAGTAGPSVPTSNLSWSAAGCYGHLPFSSAGSGSSS